MFTSETDISKNENNFKNWLNTNSTSRDRDYKKRTFKILHHGLNDHLAIKVGNLFRFSKDDRDSFFLILNSILNDKNYEGYNKATRNGQPKAALSSLFHFLGFNGNWWDQNKSLNNAKLEDFSNEKITPPIEDEKKSIEEKAPNNKEFPLQQIFFGAPGTGKSFKVNQKAPKDDKVTFRTTFHPDYDYAQFVGSYKPTRKTFAIQKLDKEELKSYANAFINDKANEGFSLCKFAAVYSESLEDLGRADRRYVIEDAAIGKTDKNEAISDKTLSASINNGISVGKLLKSKLSFNQETISYSFVPQVFAKAYVAAWERILNNGIPENEKSVYFVIEEINRGNCAQIFGDIFQLLDRKDGHSEYPIDVDSDFATYIRETLGDKFAAYKKMICSYCEDVATKNATPDEKFCKIALPSNFNILATMNTSDQSLFPMDSAFKRRFDWEYVPIDFEGKDCASFQIKIDDENSYPWQKFVESVNEKIVSITDSEDKQLGEYFIKLNPVDNNVITKERFLGKVMFYLWNEVCKDVHKQESFFREEENGNYFTFQDLYKKDGDKKLISFMDWITK